jgi:hypothetical protein
MTKRVEPTSCSTSKPAINVAIKPMVYSAVCSGVPVDGIGLIATLIAGLEVEQLVGSTLFVILTKAESGKPKPKPV